MSYRRTTFSEDYKYESVNKTVSYVPPPPLSVPKVSLIRSPSVSSVLTLGSRLSRPRSFRHKISDDNGYIDIKVEHDENNNRSESVVTFNREQSNDLDYKYKYTYNESLETNARPKLQSKSFTQISSRVFDDDQVVVHDSKPSQSVTYVFDSNDNNRAVTYVKHTESDSGSSLAGSLVKASQTFLPVTRSLQLGAIFNGNSFGLLTEHLIIKDKFNVSFDFKTSSKNGILMIIVDPNTNDSFFIELYDSQLKATLFIDGEPDSCWTDFPSSFLTNDVWINVSIQVIGTRMTMTVKNQFFTKTHRHQLLYPIRGDLFIAGHPVTIAPPFACRSRDFFIGEMRNFYVNSEGVKWYGIPSVLTPRLRNWY